MLWLVIPDTLPLAVNTSQLVGKHAGFVLFINSYKIYFFYSLHYLLLSAILWRNTYLPKKRNLHHIYNTTPGGRAHDPHILWIPTSLAEEHHNSGTTVVTSPAKFWKDEIKENPDSLSRGLSDCWGRFLEIGGEQVSFLRLGQKVSKK